MKNPFPRQAAANPTQHNIDAIAKLEHEALDRRTPTERVSDVITRLVGNVGWGRINARIEIGQADPLPKLAGGHFIP